MSRWLQELHFVLRSLIRGRRMEEELDEEIRYHLERQTDEGLKAGLSPEEARYAALRAMGPIAKSREECRDMRGINFLEDFFADLLYAGRALRRNPGFAVLAVLVMALGIGANTAVFSVVNAVLLKPLPYSDPDRIVTLLDTMTTGEAATKQVSLANFTDWHDQSSFFEAMAHYYSWEAPVMPGTAAEYAQVTRVSAEFFQVFAAEPVIGRLFTAEEVKAGSGRSLLISYAYWQDHYGGDPSVLGRTIRVYDGSMPIIGVLPPGFSFPGKTDLWFPGIGTTSRTGRNYLAIGRLKPGTSLEQAQAEMTAIAGRLEQEYPESNENHSVTLKRLHDEMVGGVRLTLYLLWGVVGLVLLIACANTATLLLGKATARTREVAVRAALGANRRRIVRQLITESLLLAIVAGAAGMLLAYWGANVLVRLAPAGLPRILETGIDADALAFTLIVSVATSLFFGLVPALHVSKVDLNDALKQGGTRSVTGGRTVRMRGLLVVSEIALAVVLVTGAGLLMKSLMALHDVELGFEPENVLVMKATGIASIRENNLYFTEIRSRIAALPGVVAVGATSIPPGDLSLAGSGSYLIDGMPEQDPRPQAMMNIVAPGTFRALGIPLKSGRDFDEGDIVNRPMVAIVNEALVRRSFGAEDPIGRTIYCSWDRDVAMTIVGVAGDVRQSGPAIVPSPVCYMPYRQHSYNNSALNIVARTAGDPTVLAGTLQRLATEVSPNVPVAFTTMDATLSENVAEPRFRALLFGVFAGLAICLAMAGIYGVMAYSVQQRSSEIGLRMALGASRSSVVRLILGQGLALAAAGLVLGLAASIGTTRLLATMLFEVQPFDAPVYLGVSALVSLVALVAGFLPAWRASVVDPVQALKVE